MSETKRAGAPSEERLLQVLVSPLLSEKTARIADEHRQFTFQVLSDATKPEIKAAVESLFEVEVDSVQVLNARGKIKRFRGEVGKRANVKKACVRLKPGFDIDFMGA